MAEKRTTPETLGPVREKIWQALLIVWLLVMYGHSMTPANISSAESGRVLAMLSGILEEAGISSAWLTEHLVRKAAHFSEYGVYGLLLMKNFRIRQQRGPKAQGMAPRFLPLAFAVLAVPFLDETIQIFSPGRSPQISDVWLDMAGACCGIFVFAVFCQIWKRCGREPGLARQKRSGKDEAH